VRAKAAAGAQWGCVHVTDGARRGAWLEGRSPQAAVTVATGMRQGESRVS